MDGLRGVTGCGGDISGRRWTYFLYLAELTKLAKVVELPWEMGSRSYSLRPVGRAR
jgi:hypothetical protein